MDDYHVNLLKRIDGLSDALIKIDDLIIQTEFRPETTITKLREEIKQIVKDASEFGLEEEEAIMLWHKIL